MSTEILNDRTRSRCNAWGRIYKKKKIIIRTALYVYYNNNNNNNNNNNTKYTHIKVILTL